MRLNRRKSQSPNRVIHVAFHVNGVKRSFVIPWAWLSYNIKHRGYLWTDKNLGAKLDIRPKVGGHLCILSHRSIKV